MPGSCLSSCSLALFRSSKGAAAVLGALVAVLEGVALFFCGSAVREKEKAASRTRMYPRYLKRYVPSFMREPPATILAEVDARERKFAGDGMVYCNRGRSCSFEIKPSKIARTCFRY